MTKFQIIPYTEDYFDLWNKFIQSSINGTLFHRLDFLAYHRNKFARNAHNLMWMKGNSLYAVLPMAVIEEREKRIAVSPYGTSYGGFVTRKLLGYDKASILIKKFIEYFHKQNIDECRLTFPIRAAYKEFSETLFLVLYENGFILDNADISSVVELKEEIKNKMHSSAKRNVQKAEREGISFRHDVPLRDFKVPFDKTFQKHNTKPTHSIEELNWLHEHFPSSVFFDVAYFNDLPVSGICHFVQNNRLDSSFYLCNDPEYEKYQGLPYLIYYSLLHSRRNGFQFFDFGTSSVNTQGRPNIFKFKEKFGAIGQFRNTFIWKKSVK
ncbi:MAG: hypothetical protein R6U04_14265 [Bacteroidales bacterium]